MMSIRRSIFVLLLISMMPVQAFAEGGELLLPVEQFVADIARVENDYFLRADLYSAKQYKIVRVNKELLESGGQISISLFGDDKMLLDPIDVSYRRNNSSIKWSGTLANPPITTIELVKQLNTDEEDAKQVHSSLFDVNISASPYEYDAAYGVNVPYVNGVDFTMSENAGNGRFFYGVSFRIRTPNLKRTFRLKPLGMGGGALHVLYELDESKRVSPPPEYGTETAESAENKMKRLDKQAYLKSLGEDPRIEKIREREAAMRERN